MRIGFGLLLALLLAVFARTAYAGPGRTRDDSCGKGEEQTPQGCMTPPKLSHKEDPIFPKKAREQGLAGSVTLSALIMTDGSVTDVKVQKSSNPGHGFEEAAIEALKKRRYKPATIDGKPITLFYTATIDFRKP